MEGKKSKVTHSKDWSVEPLTARKSKNMFWVTSILDMLFEVSILYSRWEVQAEAQKRVWGSQRDGFGGHRTIGGSRIHETGKGYPGTVGRGMVKLARPNFPNDVWCQLKAKSRWTQASWLYIGKIVTTCSLLKDSGNWLGKWQVAQTLREINQKTESRRFKEIPELYLLGIWLILTSIGYLPLHVLFHGSFNDVGVKVWDHALSQRWTICHGQSLTTCPQTGSWEHSLDPDH